MIDDTFALLSSIKLLHKHLWGAEEELTIADTYNFAMANNRLNSFLGWGGNRLDTAKTFYQWKFWQFICERLEEEAWEELRKLLKQSPRYLELSFSFWLFCIIVGWLLASSWDSQNSKVDKDCLDPPIIFTPIPGIEIGGYARNDSLTVPAIN